MANGKGTSVATPLPDSQDMPSVPGEILAQGKALQRAGTPFVTAISVQKPRDLDKIVKAMDREAEYAGDSFYYHWVDKKGNLIEGASIGLANSLAREWTNCALTVDFQETDETFIITPRFIDIEKGFQSERVYRQRKNVVAGNFDPDRKLDMALQIGQSKAIRNVIVNAVPRWLVERAIDKAKAAVVKGIDPKKLGELKSEIVATFKGYGVSQERLVERSKRPLAEWTTRDIAEFRGDIKALQNGEITISELFPPLEPMAPSGPVKLDDALAAKAVQETTPKAGALKCVRPNCAFSTDDSQAMADHQAGVHGSGTVERPSKSQTPPSATGAGGLFG
jgi:hypothetical protein